MRAHGDGQVTTRCHLLVTERPRGRPYSATHTDKPREATMTEQSNREIQLVVFEVRGELYGAEIERIHEIIRPQEITRVPRAPEFVEGVINLRGRIVPVANLS